MKRNCLDNLGYRFALYKIFRELLGLSFTLY